LNKLTIALKGPPLGQEVEEQMRQQQKTGAAD
jgi:hypothetical protein